MTIDAEQPATGFAVWNLGFRPFFLGAGVFSIISIGLWLFVYSSRTQVYPPGIAVTLWHAHEMLFGYAFAVIAGFLLTAVKNWTGLQTPHRAPLAGLFGLWVVARVLNHLGSMPLAIGATVDVLFNCLIVAAVSAPILKTRQWKQTAIIGKLVLLAILNVFFYLDAFGFFEHGAFYAVYGAFYTILALILMMMRRLIPFFVERGVDYKVTLRNSKFLDIASLILFVELMISELFAVWVGPTRWVAGALFLIHLARLVIWYTPGIWRRPLLWSLYLAYAMLIIGFLLFALNTLLGIPKLLALHAFAIGGIGVITLSMMARVSLGHSGRNIHEPPFVVSIAFVLLTAAVITRVVGPIVDGAHYSRWVEVSGGMWILAFAAFTAAYAPILLKPRVDGAYG
ncbi:MAG: NnrS family protein [Gammaproteobacteria bacterium]|nr:NnrS family protein [Gammaproteobacteria bacterium]MDH3766907.1 NnrS family protein [Gammaproteobacteria bacterium]